MDSLSGDKVDNLVEQITARIEDVTRTACPELTTLWADLWDSNEQNNRVSILVDHCTEELRTLLDRVITKERNTKEEYITRVEKLLDEIASLQTDLQVKIPYEEVESLPLHCMALRLNEKAERYRVVRNDRLSKWKDLNNRQKELSDVLGLLSGTSNVPSIPSEQQIFSLGETVAKMEAEKLERTMVFMEKRDRIEELFKQLGESPMFPFDKEVVRDKCASDFKVSVENMTELNRLLERLEEKVNNAKERREYLISQLHSLWQYLDEPQQQRDNLLDQCAGIDLSCLELLQKELDRCKAEKSANIGKFVERIRIQLKEEWDRCFVSQEKRDEFRLFRINTFNEDIYDFHEAELHRWQQFYEDNVKIFELYARHTELMQRLVVLEGRERNTGRLQNRGGQLLLEERERKLVAKELPRVGRELNSLLVSYHERHNEPFFYFGQPLEAKLREEWESNFDQKVIDRFRDGGSTRKMVRTPMSLKRAAGQTPASCSTEPKVSRLMKQKTTLGISSKARVQLKMQDQTHEVMPSYEEFQRTFNMKVLHGKTMSRSTEVLTPSRVLGEQNVKSTLPVPTWTSIKTPKTVPRTARRPPIPNHTPSKGRV